MAYNLRFPDWINLIDGLQFNNDKIFDKQIYAKSFVKLYSIVNYGYIQKTVILSLTQNPLFLFYHFRNGRGIFITCFMSFRAEHRVAEKSHY